MNRNLDKVSIIVLVALVFLSLQQHLICNNHITKTQIDKEAQKTAKTNAIEAL
jgi:hypothetical protein